MNTEMNFCLKEVLELEEKTDEDLRLEVIVAGWRLDGVWTLGVYMCIV